MQLTRPIPTPDNWQTIPIHPMAELCQFGTGIDIEAMASGISALGYDDDEPLVFFEDQLFDGRHRREGAIKADIVPPCAEFTGTKEQAVLFIEKKFLRQHLTESQRAMFAAGMLVARSGKTPIGAVNIDRAAEMMNVGTSSVDRARKVLKSGSKKLKDAVRTGAVTVAAAAAVADEDEEVQDLYADSIQPAKCKQCKRTGVDVPKCPACAEARAKQEKPKLPTRANRKPVKKKPLTKPALVWDDIAEKFGEISRFLLEAKTKDEPTRNLLIDRVGRLSKQVKEWAEPS